VNHQDWNIFPGIRYGAVALFSGQLSNQRARIWPNVPGILISPDRIHPVLYPLASRDSRVAWRLCLVGAVLQALIIALSILLPVPINNQIAALDLRHLPRNAVNFCAA
jgi:hypothetical protein